MYAPTWISLFINPFYFVRKGLYVHIKDIAPNITGRTLDIGCGSKPYKSLYKSSEYVGLEFDTPENRRIKNADYLFNMCDAIMCVANNTQNHFLISTS